MPSIEPFDITRGDIKFPTDQWREAIRIPHCEVQGWPTYGYNDATGVSHDLGLFGDFDRLGVVDTVAGLSIYDGAREADGLHIPRVCFQPCGLDALELGCGGLLHPAPGDRVESRGRPSTLPSPFAPRTCTPMNL